MVKAALALLLVYVPLVMTSDESVSHALHTVLGRDGSTSAVEPSVPRGAWLQRRP